MEELFIDWLKEYGYIVLFFWSIVEGEVGLVMAGVMTHTGDMNYVMSIFVAGLGGFAGDQIYFYIGRFNKGFSSLDIHRRPSGYDGFFMRKKNRKIKKILDKASNSRSRTLKNTFDLKVFFRVRPMGILFAHGFAYVFHLSSSPIPLSMDYFFATGCSHPVPRNLC